MPILQAQHNKKDKSPRYNLTIPNQMVRNFQWKAGMELIVDYGKEARTLIIREMPNNAKPEEAATKTPSGNTVYSLLKQAKEAGINLTPVQERLFEKLNPEKKGDLL